MNRTPGLAITIDRADGQVRATLRRSPPPDLARLLRGRGPEEARRLVPLVLGVCAEAQGLACAGALGMPVTPAASRRADAEAVREHAMLLLVHLPEALGWSADRTALRGLGQLPELAARDPDALAPRLATVRAAVFGADGPDALADLAAFEAWLDTDLPVARVLGVLWREWEPGWGRAVRPGWPPALPPDPAALAARAAEPGFRLHPEWQGTAHEAGPLAQFPAHPLVQAMTARHGRGLALRVVARLLDLARRLAALAAPPGATEPAPAGLGLAAAARGQLLHWARLEDGRIADYAAISPTDWNLHPHGILAAVLAALPANDARAPRARIARVAVACVDPCLPVMLEAA